MTDAVTESLNLVAYNRALQIMSSSDPLHQIVNVEKEIQNLFKLVTSPSSAIRGTYYFDNIIRKKDKSIRVLVVPVKRLKEVQQQILHVLNEAIKLPDHVTAKVGSSYTINASRHLGAHHILNMDIRGFYESVTSEKIRSVVAEYYPEHLEFFKLHTMFLFVGPKGLATDMSTWYTHPNGGQSDWPPLNTVTHKHLFLPTGAPTSPFISNIAALPLDSKILNYIAKYNGTYTRYIDDITISFKQELTNVQMNEIREQITKFFEEEGWKLHPLKTKWLDPSINRITVTGIDIRGDQIRVSNRYIKDKIKPWIDREAARVVYLSTYWHPHFTRRMIDKGINTFEDTISLFFSKSFVSTLEYIKQVNIDQYNKCIEYIKLRLLAHQKFNYVTAGRTLHELVARYCDRVVDHPVAMKYRSGGSIVDALLDLSKDRLDKYRRDQDEPTPF